MSNSKKALLLVMMQIDPETEDEFNRWYDEEHLPERMALPGFLVGRRFKAIEGEPRYLALYDLEDTDVLKSNAYLAKLNEEYTDWTARMRTKFKIVKRNVYVEITSK